MGTTKNQILGNRAPPVESEKNMTQILDLPFNKTKQKHRPRLVPPKHKLCGIGSDISLF